MVRSTLLPVTRLRQTGQVRKSSLFIFIAILAHSGARITCQSCPRLQIGLTGQCINVLGSILAHWLLLWTRGRIGNSQLLRVFADILICKIRRHGPILHLLTCQICFLICFHPTSVHLERHRLCNRRFSIYETENDFCSNTYARLLSFLTLFFRPNIARNVCCTSKQRRERRCAYHAQLRALE